VDTVLVDPGIYIEAVRFGTKPARLVSSAGPSVTYITPPPGQVAVSFGDGVSKGVLNGFTISNGIAGISITSGLASCGACTPTIVSNVIVNCGKGIGVVVSSPTIIYNHITLCAGDGILLQGAAAALIEGNLIEHNGVGITTLAAGSPTIRNNIVRRNLGTGILLSNDYLPTEAKIGQNLVVNNAGYGIFFAGVNTWIMNNTLAGNRL